MSDLYSKLICESCNSKLSELIDFRNEIIEYQRLLYNLYEQEKMKNSCEENLEENEEKTVTILENFIISEIDTQQLNSLSNKPKVEKFCEKCKKYFSINSFYHHQMRFHQKTKIFQCDYDGKQFKLKGDLNSHMKIHTKLESRQKFRCSTCNSEFLSTSALKNHEKLYHSEYVEEMHPCETCSKIFGTRMKLMQHIKSVHEKKGNYECGKCKKIYSSFPSLKKHLIKHETEKESCNLCGKIFHIGSSMKNHMKTHQDPEFLCSHQNCDKSFYTKASLKVHLKSHNDQNESFECSECNSHFKSSRCLQRHKERQHSSIQIQCEIPSCFKSFTRKDKMINHYKVLHEELDKETRDKLIEQAKICKILKW